MMMVISIIIIMIIFIIIIAIITIIIIIIMLLLMREEVEICRMVQQGGNWVEETEAGRLHRQLPAFSFQPNCPTLLKLKLNS